MTEDSNAQAGLDALLQPGSLDEASFHWWNRTDLPPCRHEWLREAAMHSNLDLGHYPARYLPEKKAEVHRLLTNDLALEEPVEMPLTIESPTWTLGILAVYKGNLRQHTCFDAHRDQVLQWLDAGSYHAAQSGKRFLTLVIYTDGRTYNSETRALVRRYQNRPEVLRGRLPYRHDEETLGEASKWLGDLRWRDIGALLLDTKEEARLGLFDQTILDELVKYLARKDVGFNFFRRLK